ncbi:MAG: hypothetical protein ACE5Z5_11565 [Candidatus Bathyarchaeia archaeon]
MGGSALIDSVTLSWGRRCTVYLSVSDPAKTSVYFQDAEGVDHLVDDVEVDDTDINWVQAHGKKVYQSWITSSGWYKIIIVVQVELQNSRRNPPELKMYFDDIGLEIRTLTQITDWYASFTINEDPTLITQLDIAYTGHYNTTLSQGLYVLDATNNGWVLLEGSTISTSSKTLRFTLTGADVQNYVSNPGDIQIRAYAITPTPFTCTADSLTLSDYFTEGNNRITITLKNTGGTTAHLVSLWIIGSIGHHRHDLDLNLSPGQSITYVATHSWSHGEYTFKITTDKGTIAMYTATA